MRIYFEKLVIAEWSFYNQYDYVFYHIFPLVYCFWFLPVFAHWMHQFGWSEFSIDRSVFVEQFVKIFDGASLFVPFSPIMQMTDRRHLWINMQFRAIHPSNHREEHNILSQYNDGQKRNSGSVNIFRRWQCVVYGSQYIFPNCQHFELRHNITTSTSLSLAQRIYSAIWFHLQSAEVQLIGSAMAKA